MPIPSVVSVGAFCTGVPPVSFLLPGSIAVNDILLVQIASSFTEGGISPVNSNGGTWAGAGGVAGGGSVAGNGSRGTWFWSRYNGTQGPPTFNGTIFHHSRMIAIRDCITTGSPIDIDAVFGTTFVETTTNIPTVTTLGNQRLIIVGVVGALPDLDSTGIYSAWTNANLSSLTELFNDSSSVAAGGSIGMAAGGLAVMGATGITTVAHASMHMSAKTLAFIPAVVTATDIFRAGRVPIRLVADAPGVVPIRYTTAGAGVTPVVTTTATDAGVVPVVVKADAPGVVPVVETA